MTEFSWLASYPKSGNTWLRMLVANLGAGDEPADINAASGRGGIASGRGEFHFHTFIDSGLLTHDEAQALRPRVYEAMRADAGASDDDPRPWLIKVHDAYLPTQLGEPLLAGPRGAQRAILVVRDPRAVVPSLASHRGTSIDEAIAFLNDPAASFAGGFRGQTQQLRQRLLDWSGHVASWLDQRDLPVHLLRYEDLLATPVDTFAAAMAFVGYEASPAELGKAVAFAAFERLQAQERTHGFSEWRRSEGGALFFRQGESQGWRRELTPDQVRRIEAAHAPTMARLGYPIGAQAAAESGAT